MKHTAHTHTHTTDHRDHAERATHVFAHSPQPTICTTTNMMDYYVLRISQTHRARAYMQHAPAHSEHHDPGAGVQAHPQTEHTPAFVECENQTDRNAHHPKGGNADEGRKPHHACASEDAAQCSRTKRPRHYLHNQPTTRTTTTANTPTPLN